jgi:hypothetical protein
LLRISERRARLLGLDRRETPITVKLPRMDKAEDAMPIVSALLAKTADGELLPEEAAKISTIVQAFMRIAEVTELAQKVKGLEEKIDGTQRDSAV